jgi:hypothetical protein
MFFKVLILDPMTVFNYQARTNRDDIVTKQFNVFATYKRLPEDGH